MQEKFVTQKTFIFTVMMLCAFMILCSATLLCFTSDKTMTTISDTTVNSEPEILYIVMSHEGKIGIFNPSGTEPVEVLDVYVANLPDSDKNYLSRGIKIYSDSQLLSIIEDYTG